MIYEVRMTDGQLKRVKRIIDDYQHFKYGLGQSDHDIRFLLTLLTGEDPSLVKDDLKKDEDPVK
jgi:hypothetical protein